MPDPFPSDADILASIQRRWNERTDQRPPRPHRESRVTWRPMTPEEIASGAPRLTVVVGRMGEADDHIIRGED